MNIFMCLTDMIFYIYVNVPRKEVETDIYTYGHLSMQIRLLTKTILGDNLSQSQTAAFCHRRRSVKLLLLNLETAKAKVSNFLSYAF